MIALLAAATAFASFGHELNLSQALAASLGGTLLRYQTGFGLFTCFLGFGALTYQSLQKKIEPRDILIKAQIILIGLGTLGPSWIDFFSPMKRSPSQTELFSIACYLPLVAVAFISGFELPALMELAKRIGKNSFRALAWDYWGMVGASLAYPLVLLDGLGIKGSSILMGLINAIALAMCTRIPQRLPNTDDQKAVDTHPEKTLNSGLIASLLFFVSFCSMTYELLLAAIISDLIQNEVLAHALTIGLFLLGLGAGTARSQRYKDPVLGLLRVELSLTTLGALGLIILMGLATFWTTYMGIPEVMRKSELLILLLSPLALLIGYLSGFELPLLLRLWGCENSFGLAFSLNYSGALAAGLMVPLWMLPSWGAGPSLIFTATINFICAGIILLFAVRRAIYGIALFFTGLIVIQALPLTIKIEQVFLKSHYFQLRIDSINLTAFKNYLLSLSAIKNIYRKTTAYQNIDLIEPNTGTGAFSLNQFALYLNRQPQFNSIDWTTYHQSLMYGAFNLAGQVPQSVLILGGGDGILAGQLLETENVKSITLVEIDKAVVQLSQTHSQILAMNQGSLSHPKLHIVYEDAFVFLHQTRQHFDAIFIDFPYPVNYELSRLFSTEFFQAVLHTLTPNGFVALDAPIWFDLEKNKENPQAYTLLMNTLHFSGFKSLYTFGPMEPFLFAQAEPKNLAFDYSKLPKGLANSVFVNLTPIDHFTLPMQWDAKMVNSVFWPKRFQLK